jgi:hypothetical protein
MKCEVDLAFIFLPQSFLLFFVSFVYFVVDNSNRRAG